MASSILTSALPSSDAGRQARVELVANSDEDYENKAIHLCADLRYLPNGQGLAEGRLVEMRKMLFLNRWQNELFNTRRWVNDLENAYEKVWDAWVRGEEGDIWL
jgi:predicted O-linked N-acetylglucosamine transferase (SPINDLY family)